MQPQRSDVLNVILFATLSIAVLIAWPQFVMPLFMPKKPPAAPQNAAADPKAADEKSGKPDAEHAVANSDGKPQTAPTATEPPKTGAAEKPAEQKRQPAAVYEHKTVVLGSKDPSTGYFLRTELSSTGASVDLIEFNDPRYRELSDAAVPLRIVGSDPGLKYRTFSTKVPEIDALLAADHSNLADRDWSIAQIMPDAKQQGVNTAVTFRYPSPDGALILEKRYSLDPIPGAGDGGGKSREAQDVRDANPDGYLIHLEITLKNVGKEKRATSYVLQGPVGLPLENINNARKFRDIKLGFLSPSGAVTSQTVSVTKVVDDEEKKKPEEWKAPLKYIGVDVQYFAALVLPLDDQLEHQTVDRSAPMVLDHPKEKAHTELSFELDSKKIALDPAQAVTEKYALFAGPKRKALLQPLGAAGAMDSYWFADVTGAAYVSHAMLALLWFFHSLGIPYGFAIICLTIFVRACMFPLSLKQAAQGQRMKEMQPKVAEIKKKYANDKEKLAMANWELMRQYKVNPLSGCLPLFVQLPVLTGLYLGLQNAVDLRRAPFLYFNNLAAPDELFHLPFAVPFFGWTEFNLLPIITVALFVCQQKLFMPPAADEQQEMQYKMMNIMTIVMGVMFYKVPAGLCVYFISSSLWGIGERKLLDWRKKKQQAASPTPELPEQENPKKPVEKAAENASVREPGIAGRFWQRLVDAADAAGAEGTSGTKSNTSRRVPPAPGKKNGKRPR